MERNPRQVAINNFRIKTPFISFVGTKQTNIYKKHILLCEVQVFVKDADGTKVLASLVG
jgi:hypothetical protein